MKSGFVALLGRPNVGKSTLLNRLVGTRVAIVSPLPQTTRRRIVGVVHRPDLQIVFVDTPGFVRPRHALGEVMLERAQAEGREADLVLFMVDASCDPTAEDREVAEFLARAGRPTLLVCNKADLVHPKEYLLPRIQAYNSLGTFEEVFPVSALTGDNVEALVEAVAARLPEGPPYFPEGVITDLDEQTLIEEIVREKVLMNARQEVPHAVAVQVEEMRPGQDGKTLYVRATVYVEKEGQKGILVGKGGRMLKEIGRLAREELEFRLGRPVFLDLWVKVKKDWRARADWVRALGYE
ncbi:MAG TPA: GTPase Era [Candidatus Nitrosotenuis sp.]|nr:GTPase Era [Candidatus Nitrosotenuis sp.]